MTSPLSRQKETYGTLWRVNSLTRLIFFFRLGFLVVFSLFLHFKISSYLLLLVADRSIEDW